MKNNKINKRFHQGFALSILILIVMIPVTGQYVLLGIQWAFAQIFIYGGAVISVPATYVIVYVLYFGLRGQGVKIPKRELNPLKGKTHKAGRFIEV